VPTSKVNEIKVAIEALHEEEYAQLRQWFSERDWDKWDRQSEADSRLRNLDSLIKEALDEKSKGNLEGPVMHRTTGSGSGHATNTRE
jgi:hypothetical protein